MALVFQGLQAFQLRTPYVTGQKQTVQNQRAKRVNEGIRTPTDVTYSSFKPCGSRLSSLHDKAFDSSLSDMKAGLNALGARFRISSTSLLQIKIRR